jgi:mannosyltransferase OCH1-like enzyme
MIDKVIHYVWLGGRELDKNSQMCMNTWYRNLRDYKIIRWDETNIPIGKYRKDNRFFDSCFKLKLWAFASDYLRLRILYENGGIYLDTDVEVVKSFTDILKSDFFIGYEKDYYIGTGIIGAEKHSPKIRKLLEFYDREIWEVDYINNPIIFKNVIERNTGLFNINNIYPKEYFAPYDPNVTYSSIIESANTYTIHWYNKNWGMSRKGYVFMTTKNIKNPFMRKLVSLKRIIGYYRKGMCKDK